MAGKIIADTIEASGSQISLNVGNVTVLTASSTGLTLTPTTNVNINIANSSATFTTANITTANITGVATFSTGTAALPSITTAGDPDTGIYFPSANTIGFTRGGVEVGRFDSNSANANFQFNSGYGSVATAYGCRAWVNFNGTGTVAIRGSGNVTSITDNGTGSYTVIFTTAMPDVNYAVKGAASLGTRYAFVSIASTPTTANVAIIVYDDTGATQDCAQVHASMEVLAQEIVPAGKPYKIVDVADIPSDRTFRNAWEYTA